MPVVGEPTRLKRSDAVIHAGAVEKDCKRSLWRVGSAAGCDEHPLSAEINQHDASLRRPARV
jgi:hypothetical protein